MTRQKTKGEPIPDEKWTGKWAPVVAVFGVEVDLTMTRC